MNGEGELPPIMNSLLTVKGMVVINVDQGLLMSLSYMMRTTIMSTEIEIHLPKAWEIMR